MKNLLPRIIELVRSKIQNVKWELLETKFNESFLKTTDHVIFAKQLYQSEVLCQANGNKLRGVYINTRFQSITALNLYYKIALECIDEYMQNRLTSSFTKMQPMTNKSDIWVYDWLPANTFPITDFISLYSQLHITYIELCQQYPNIVYSPYVSAIEESLIEGRNLIYDTISIRNI